MQIPVFANKAMVDTKIDVPYVHLAILSIQMVFARYAR